jgi:isocitrate/isopropylmalate dehydrogenase
MKSYNIALIPGDGTGPEGPEHIDFVVVRENTGGIYTGIGGVTHKGTPLENTVQVMTYSRPVVERCVKYAYELSRPLPVGAATISLRTRTSSCV